MSEVVALAPRAVPVAAALRHPAFDAQLERCVEAQYFESRLGADADQVDHLVAFPRRAAGLVHRQLSSLARCAEAQRAPWQVVTRVFERWCDGRSSVSQHVPTVWLEYDDVHAEHAHHAAPSICVCMVPNYQFDRPLVARNADRERLIISEVLDLLPTQPTSAQARALAACMGEQAIRWIHLSAMVGRKAPTLKLYGLLQRRELRSCLRRLEFGGDELDVEGFMNEHYPRDRLGEQLFVDVDLSTLADPNSASLGLAISRQHVAHRDARELHTALLDGWSRAGLCDPAKRLALQAWIDPPRPGKGPGESRRFLDFKLVWRTRASPIAKAYRGLYGGAPLSILE